MVKIKSFIFAIFCIGISNNNWAQQTLNWSFIHPISKKEIVLGEKGSVQEQLMESEGINPFYGTNGGVFDWVEKYDWTFFSDFMLTEQDLNHRIDLDFPNVDTYAQIYLNGQLIGHTENAFVHYRFDISSQAKLGKNSVKIIFQSPVNYQKKHAKDVGVKLPSPNDSGKEKIAPYCRKPQYQFGWDWSLRMNTVGFWEPAHVIIYDQNRVIGTTKNTLSISPDSANQQFTLYLRNESSAQFIWKSKLFGDRKVQAKDGKIERLETVITPKLWWPRGQGDPFLYNDEWLLLTLTGDTIYSESQIFGIRTSELIQKKDQWGTSFELKINGRILFCKGSDYIPDDIFPSRISDQKLIERVQLMAECNFNMVRIWGGGMYPKEVFLTACDSLGIMVWEDFMFACAMYPGNDSFLRNVQVELNQQIPRIAAHPAVVLFNGNNEVDVAWKNWGFQSTYHLSAADCKLIESYYDKLFKGIIPLSVKQFTNLPYEHTSPLSNWGKDEFFNHGTQHYWGVWHGKDPLTDFARKAGRFNAEYGFQSFPEFSTLASFSQPSEWKLDSPVMQYHQKSYVGNGMIEKHADQLFGKTADFERFVYYSQLTQAKAVSMAIVSHRMQFPRVAGTLYWQLNDCWPAPTWSSIDYFGNWKALQYQVRADYGDLTIVSTTDSLGKDHFHLLSDLPNGFGVEVSLKIVDFSGKQLANYTCNQTVLGPSTIQLFESELRTQDFQDVVYVFSWKTPLDSLKTRVFVHESTIRNPIQNAKIDFEINYNSSTKKGVLVVKTNQLLIDFWISSLKQNVHFERNFETLLPGRNELFFTSPEKIENGDLKWFYR